MFEILQGTQLSTVRSYFKIMLHTLTPTRWRPESIRNQLTSNTLQLRLVAEGVVVSQQQRQRQLEQINGCNFFELFFSPWFVVVANSLDWCKDCLFVYAKAGTKIVMVHAEWCVQLHESTTGIHACEQIRSHVLNAHTINRVCEDGNDDDNGVVLREGIIVLMNKLVFPSEKIRNAPILASQRKTKQMLIIFYAILNRLHSCTKGIFGDQSCHSINSLCISIPNNFYFLFYFSFSFVCANKDFSHALFIAIQTIAFIYLEWKASS